MNKRGIKSFNNPNRFRAILTRVVAGTKERPYLTLIDEALSRPNKDKWLAAAKEELANHDK